MKGLWVSLFWLVCFLPHTVSDAVIHVSRGVPPSPPQEHQYSAVSTDTYEAVMAYEEGPGVGGRGRGRPRARGPPPPPRQDLRHLRLNTESTTDLSMDCYNFSDEDDDITQSCSDTEASFFIPHDGRRGSDSRGEVKDSPGDDSHTPFSSLLRSSCAVDDTNFPNTFLRPAGEERNTKDKNSIYSSKGPDATPESLPTSNTSSLNPLVADGSETSSTRRVSCRSSFSQDSLEEQFERTLSLISQGVAGNLD